MKNKPFYVVDQLIKGRDNHLRKKFKDRGDAIVYAVLMDGLRESEDNSEVHLYEVKELEF